MNTFTIENNKPVTTPNAALARGNTVSVTQPCLPAEERPKALVVDDDPVMLGLLERYLTRAGYQTLTALEAGQGVALAVQHVPAVIVMDVMMPELSGLAALRLLRHTEATKDIPVIIISANDQPEAKQESIAGGAAAFLVKPFGLGQVLNEVNKAVRKT